MAKGQTKAAEKAAEYLEKNPDAAPMQVAVKFGISLSTVYRLKNAANGVENGTQKEQSNGQ